MSIIEEMSLEEVETTLSQLRQRRSLLKKSGKVAGRKIDALSRRRERLMAKVSALDTQIAALRQEAALAPESAPRRRGRRPKAAQLTVAS
jgi:outer membrane murein-binding lipoprotein Lpp